MKLRRTKTDARGLLRRFRRERDTRQEPTHQEDTEPAHDQPWVPRSAFTDRVRRSPRN
jgi:hypothetical protein